MTDHRTPSLTPERIIILAHVVVLAAIPLPIILTDGSGSGPSWWYVTGGVFMHVLTTLALMQAAVGIVLGIIHVKRELPLLIHLAMPAFAAVIGMIAAWVDQQPAMVVFHAPPDQQLAMLAAGLAITDVPLQLGFIIGGGGALGAAAVGAATVVGAADRAGESVPAPRAVGVVFGVSVVASVAGTAVAVALSDGTQSLALPVYMGAILLTVGLMAAVAAGSIPSALRSERERGRVFGGAALIVIGGPIALAGPGLALVSMVGSQSLDTVATAPPDVVLEMLTAAAVTYVDMENLAGVLVVASLLPGGVLTALAMPAVDVWMARNAGWLLAIAGLVAAVFAAGLGLESAREAGVEKVLELREPPPARFASLPQSSSRYGRAPGHPVYWLEDGQLGVGEETVGAIDDAGTYDRLAEARALLDPRPTGSEDTQCPHDSLQTVILAIPADTPIPQVQQLGDQLHLARACSVEVLARLGGAPGTLDGEDYEPLRELLPHAMAIYEANQAEKVAVLPMRLVGTVHAAAAAETTRLVIGAESVDVRGTMTDFVAALDAARLAGDDDDGIHWAAGRALPGVVEAPRGFGQATPLVGGGSLSKESIQEVISRNKMQIRYCYELQLQRMPGLGGKLVVQWKIGPDGAVNGVSIRENTVNHAEMERCIMEKISRWRFPPPSGGGIVEVNYPFVFKAG